MKRELTIFIGALIVLGAGLWLVFAVGPVRANAYNHIETYWQPSVSPSASPSPTPTPQPSVTPAPTVEPTATPSATPTPSTEPEVHNIGDDGGDGLGCAAHDCSVHQENKVVIPSGPPKTGRG